ncbi:RICIN domain-containing protein [Streptomyces sp. E5N91]|uniref:RICIN domain-containing protein n=1 Tax=Streptomyces sp. E5N91 TaxID=1851996 RepID=UPI001EE87D5E|nr:RICIN domain-containing protein [Streptomyces sp. E5N91]
MPRLTQYSSLGPRARASDSSGGPPPAADSGGEHSKARLKDRAKGVFRRRGNEARREGFRGALGVVGVVGVLSAIAETLALGLGGEDEGRRGDGRSTVVGTGDYGQDDVAGLSAAAVPSANVPGDKRAGDGAKTEVTAVPTKPSVSASPGSSASPDGAAAPGGQPSAPAQGTASSGESAPKPVPGAAVFSHASQRCIDVVGGGSATPGAGLMIRDCSDSASQHWTFPSDGTMRSLGLCVELAGGSTADGAISA